jgi:hypothetical protein
LISEKTYLSVLRRDEWQETSALADWTLNSSEEEAVNFDEAEALVVQMALAVAVAGDDRGFVDPFRNQDRCPPARH